MEAVCEKMAQWILEDVKPETSEDDVVAPAADEVAALAPAAAAEPQEDEGFCEV